jgi:hypothetical protein
MTDSLSHIDSPLTHWATAHGAKVVAGDESRSIYFGSGHDCCQIWLAGPLEDPITVRASDVESLLDDAELEFEVSVNLVALESGLDAALRRIKVWFARSGAQA